MKVSVETALLAELQAALQAASDNMVRLELSPSWPVVGALVALRQIEPDLSVGVLSPFRPGPFVSAGLPIESSAATLTLWRNERLGNLEAQGLFPLVIVGTATGSEERGLQALHIVVRRQNVAAMWRQLSLQATGANYDKKPREIRNAIITTVSDRLAAGRLTPHAVDNYAGTLLDPELVEHSKLQDDLYKLGLMPDDKLIGSPSIEARLRLNAETVETIVGAGETDTRLGLLERSKRKEVTSLLRWTRSRDDDDLRESDLSVVLEVLRGKSATKGKTTPPDPEDDPPEVSSRQQLLRFLGRSEVDGTLRQEALQRLSASLGDTGHRCGSVDVSVPFGSTDVFLKCQGSDAYLQDWLEEFEDSTDDKVWVTRSDQIVFTVEVRDTHRERSKFIRVGDSTFERMVESQGRIPLLREFLTARASLMAAARLLFVAEQDLMALLVASPTLRQECGSYVDAWSALLASVEGRPSIGWIFTLVDAVWIRDLVPTESLEAPTLQASIEYRAASLAPWHPWRLGPLVRLAEEIEDNFSLRPSVVRSARWAVDRAVPAYRLLNLPPSKLVYKTIEHGRLIFGSENHSAIPPASGGAGLMGRAVGAYAKISPWARAGASIAVVNPPRGGMVRGTVRAASTVFAHQPALSLLREREVDGVDEGDDYPNLVSSADVADLAEALPAEDASRDLSLLFLRGATPQMNALHTGAHGTVSVRLAPRGFDAAGTPIFVPEIVLSASRDNNIVAGLYKAAGMDEVTSAAYDLALGEHDLRRISAIARRSGWTIVAVPGAVSAFDLRGPSGETLVRVAEFDEGLYRCFVFAQSIAPLQWLIEERLRDLPVAKSVQDQLSELIHGLAVSQPQKLFDIALNRFGVDEALGILVARAVAHRWARPKTLTLELSLDDASWSRDWLDSERQRADFLMVEISSDPQDPTPVRLLVVEAKATTSPFAPPSALASPLSEAVEQVEVTRDQLSRLMSNTDSLISMIRMRALSEHAAAAAAYAYERSADKGTFDVYFEQLSRFTESPAAAVSSVDGMAVALYLSGQEKSLRLQADGIELVSCSSMLLEQVLRNEEVDLAPAADFPRATPTPPSAAGHAPARSEGHQPEQTEQLVQTEELERTESPERPTSDSSRGQGMDEEVRLTQEDEELVDGLVTVLRLRSEDVGPPDQRQLRVGPTFIAVTLPFMKGASIAPLQRAAEDIARDAGARQVELSNDEQRGRIRILVPRAKRSFPALPKTGTAWAEGTDYITLAMGQDLAGRDVRVPLAQWPHALVAGTTGSGKTNFLRGVLSQLSQLGPSWIRCVIVDGKGETDYFGVVEPGCFAEEFPEPLLSAEDAMAVLEWLNVVEVPRRKKLVVEAARTQRRRVDAREDFVASIGGSGAPMMVPMIVVIDEFNEIMLRGGTHKQAFIDGVTSVAQAARSVMIHLVLATQRPERSVVPGPIKANLPARIAFRLPSAADSLTILGHGGAERLLGAGDMLFQLNGQPDRRLQAYRF